MMNQENGNLPTVDAALEQFSRVAVPADVERRLEARLQEFCRQPQAPVERVMPTSQRRFPGRVVRASVATAVAALFVAALFVTLGNQDAWAQVVKAMRSQPWVRWTLQIPKDAPVPDGVQIPVGWFSAEKKVFARSATNHDAQYIDLVGQETFDYVAQKKTVSRSLTSDIDNVEIGHFETLLRLVAEGDRALKLPDSPIQIVGRSRRDVSEADHRWTEYTFGCRDSRRTVTDYQVTFRVDPKTQLPVEMRSTEKFAANDPADVRIYTMDYPGVGPSDIYALGAPRDALVVDRRRAKTRTPEEIKEFLAAYVQARTKPLEPYATTMLKSDPQMEFADIYTAWRGKGDGKETRVEEVDSEQLTEFRKQIWAGKVTCPVDNRMTWWKDRLHGMRFHPFSRGEEMLPDRIGYPAELMTLGASPVDNPDCQVTLDRQPTMGPPETVLLNLRTETTVGFNDCFFWIAPQRDYLVLRHEIHFSRDHAAWNNSTQIIDKVEQSPGGRWYVTAARMGRIERHGDDLPADQVRAVGNVAPETMGPVTTSTIGCLVEFK